MQPKIKVNQLKCKKTPQLFKIPRARRFYLYCFTYIYKCSYVWDFPGGSDDRESACNVGDLDSTPGAGRFPWRMAWPPTSVFLPGKFQGQRSPWGLKELDTTEWLSTAHKGRCAIFQWGLFPRAILGSQQNWADDPEVAHMAPAPTRALPPTLSTFPTRGMYY